MGLDDFNVIAVDSALAPLSSNLNVTFTPTLMLGAITMAMSSAAAAMSAFGRR